MVVYLQRVVDNTSTRVQRHFARLMIENLDNDSDVMAMLDFLQKFTSYGKPNS